MHCARCGAAVSSSSRFCDQCGAAQFVARCGDDHTAAPNVPFNADPRLHGTVDAAATTTRLAAPSAGPSAERRQLTVMFCDLVGSTALSSRLDPEDLSEVIGRYHRCVADTVARFGGFVARVVGDGALVYFGYPQAREDDAQSAVHAGLATIDAVSALSLAEHYVPQVRVGIATGLVVVGHLVGSSDAQAYEAVGETPNLAARLQALAEPNEMVIAHETRKLVGDLFEYRDRGTVEVKGFAAPIHVWQVMRASGLASRSQVLHASARTRFVGRDEEMQLLQARWEQARCGNGQVVLLVAEPGLGKSRLIMALQEHLEAEPHACRSYFCSPHHQDSTLHPFISQIERAAEFRRDDTPAMRTAKLASAVAAWSPSAEEFALLADLLSLSGADGGTAPPHSSQEKRKKTFDLLLRQVECAALQTPLLMVFEDAHWSDATSREFLDLLADRAREWPLLLVVTSRPDFSPAWLGRPDSTVVNLNRLNERDGAAIVQQVLGHHTLPAAILEEIVERTDGVPLFLEELTKAVLETGSVEAEARVAPASPPPMAIPTTLHGSLMARLDRLGPKAKEVAQVGAAIGREFAHDLLAAVMPWTDDELDTALERLVVAGLAFRRGASEHVTYLFKHGLVQDAAYATLLRSKRQQLHARIAEALEQLFPQVVERQPELLAHHLTEAAKFDDALRFWRVAGNRAVRNSAYREAIGHCARGLRILGTMDRGDGHLRDEMVLQLQHGIALTASLGPAAPSMFDAFNRARVIAEQLQDQRSLASAFLGLWAHHQAQAQFEPAIAFAERLVALGEAAGEDALRVQGHAASLTVAYKMGRFESAWRHFEHGMALHRPGMQVIEAIPNYTNPGPDMRLHGSFVAWVLGYPARAKKLAEGTIAAARATGQPYTITHCTYMLGHLAELQGDWAAVRQANARTIELATSGGFRGTLQLVERRVALVAVVLDQDEEQFRIKCAHRQPGFARALHDVALARMCGSLGVAHRGLAMLDEALAYSAETGSCFFDAEVYRTQGQLFESVGRTRDAEERFFRAIETARTQGARMWELRAATDLARMWAGRGEPRRALELLAPVYAWFTEGFDIPELRAARSVLQNLGLEWEDGLAAAARPRVPCYTDVAAVQIIVGSKGPLPIGAVPPATSTPPEDPCAMPP